MRKPLTLIHDDYDYYVNIDDFAEDPALEIIVVNVETEEIVNAVGGVEVRFWVSDHGNIHVDPDDEPYVIGWVNELITDILPKGAAA
jgi:hypothetical protein